MTKNRTGILAIILVVIAAAAGGYYYLYLPRAAGTASTPTAANSSGSVRYQTARVTKSTLSDTIQTTGAIRSNQTTALAWQTSGTVLTLNGSKGQVVPAKTVLAELDPATLPQNVILAQADLVTAQKNLDTLLTSSQVRANAQLTLVKAQQALDDATKARRNRQYQRASEETIDIARANLIASNDALDKAQEIYERSRNRNKEDSVYAAALSQYARARQVQITAQYNLNYVMGLPDPLDIQEADAKVAVAEANVLQAKLDWERVKDGPNEQDVSAAQARVTAARAALNMAHIIAPFAGTITLSNNKVGDQVAAGGISFQLDDLSHLYVDAAVAEMDITRVKIGQAVTLTVDALPGRTYSGVVTDIGLVGKTTGSTVNFTVTVEITQPGDELKPGMSISAAITTGQNTDILLVPAHAICAQNGQQVVYLFKNNAPAPVMVETGSPVDTSTAAVTRSALQEGDGVISNPDCSSASASALAPIPLPELAEARPSPTPAPTATQPAAAPTVMDASAQANAQAVQTVKDYFSALEKNDYQAASNYLSTFSLAVDNLSRGDGADELHSQLARGMKWSNLAVKETQVFNDKTLLVHVTYQLTTPDPKGGPAIQADMDEMWPVTQEQGKWLYSRNNLIDFRTLSVADQMMGGLRVQPVRLARYADHIRLTLLVQNTTNETIVLGQPNEIMASFSFKDQHVEAEKTRLIFARLRTYSQTNIDIKGLFASYPDGVIIRQWKNLKVDPWFTFRFSD